MILCIAQYATGSTNSVNAEATSRPPMMVAAIPPNIASNSNGNIPRIVVPDAMATGMIRLVVALITAFSGAFPEAASMSIWSTNTIAFLIFIPIIGLVCMAVLWQRWQIA